LGCFIFTGYLGILGSSGRRELAKVDSFLIYINGHLKVKEIYLNLVGSEYIHKGILLGLGSLGEDL
jgi:hypothetical protein